MKKLLTILMLSIFFLSFASAGLDTLGTFRQNTNVRLRQICNDATYISLSSVTYPNSSNAISSVNMTSVGSGEFEYNFSNTNALGTYTMNGISDGCDLTFAVYFVVTESGREYLEQDAIAFGILVIILGLLLIGSLMGAIFIPWSHPKDNEEGLIISVNDWRYAKIFLIGMSYALGMMLLGSLRKFLGNGALNEFAVFANWGLQIMLAFLYPIIVLTFILMLVTFIYNRKLKQQLDRGFKVLGGF